MTEQTHPKYLSTKQAAEYISLSVPTLNRMRVTGEGPTYAKIGHRVIYALEDLDAWIEARKRRFTAENIKP